MGKCERIALKMKPDRRRFSMGRRRVLTILAAAGSLASIRMGRASSVANRPYTWRGTALGAKAQLTFYNVGPSEGQKLLNQIGHEVRRLEKIFSLYRADSVIATLNGNSHIDNPPLDLVRLMSEAHAMSEVTTGAFDVTVQPLWELYAAHLGSGGVSPGPDAVDAVLDAVGYEGVTIDSTAIRFKKPGMSITLNGIAQGYITDRVADLLYAEGLRHVLIDLGEIRALDKHPSGRPWVIGLEHPDRMGSITNKIDIANQAVATSAASGTRFDNSGLHHHIFDPSSGQSRNIYSSISVVGERATVADALSTGLYSLEPSRAQDVIDLFPGYTAYVVYADGRSQVWGG